MAEEVEMTPVAAAEPPKVNPLAKPMAPVKPPVATATGLKPALKPGLKLPTKPVIRKPGATVTAQPLPKPIVGAPKPTVPAATVNAAKPAAEKPLAEPPKPMEQLKAVTQKLKGITQEIPQQAILRKTGIIAETAMTDAQKEAAKHKTARISLSDAMGVAPVKNENAPMKTIRIKRPIDIPGATSTALKPQPKQEQATAAETPPVTTSESPTVAMPTPGSTITQRKTLKIARPGGGTVRPSGKFGIKRPGTQATTVAGKPAEGAGSGADGSVAEIADIPEMPMAPVPNAAAASAGNGPAWLWALSSVVQAAACVAMGALAWMLYQNSQIAYF